MQRGGPALPGLPLRVPKGAQAPAADPHRDTHAPGYHVAPLSGWGSDPHGPIYWRGRYHLFYQGRPGTCNWFWGLRWDHVVSNDLVSWVRLPPAIIPTPGGLDADGCFTGNIQVHPKTGVPMMFYTGARLRHNPGLQQPPPPDDAWNPFMMHWETQLCAVADPADELLVNWTKVATPWMALPHCAFLTAWRDPFFVPPQVDPTTGLPAYLRSVPATEDPAQGEAEAPAAVENGTAAIAGWAGAGAKAGVSPSPTIPPTAQPDVGDSYLAVTQPARGTGGPEGEREHMMVIGSGLEGLGGTALVYRSSDLTAGWRFEGYLCSWPNMETGLCWECPHLLHLPDLPAGLSCATHTMSPERRQHALNASSKEEQQRLVDLAAQAWRDAGMEPPDAWATTDVTIAPPTAAPPTAATLAFSRQGSLDHRGAAAAATASQTPVPQIMLEVLEGVLADAATCNMGAAGSGGGGARPITPTPITDLPTVPETEALEGAGEHASASNSGPVTPRVEATNSAAGSPFLPASAHSSFSAVDLITAASSPGEPGSTGAAQQSTSGAVTPTVRESSGQMGGGAEDRGIHTQLSMHLQHQLSSRLSQPQQLGSDRPSGLLGLAHRLSRQASRQDEDQLLAEALSDVAAQRNFTAGAVAAAAAAVTSAQAQQAAESEEAGGEGAGEVAPLTPAGLRTTLGETAQDAVVQAILMDREQRAAEVMAAGGLRPTSSHAPSPLPHSLAISRAGSAHVPTFELELAEPSFMTSAFATATDVPEAPQWGNSSSQPLYRATSGTPPIAPNVTGAGVAPANLVNMLALHGASLRDIKATGEAGLAGLGYVGVLSHHVPYDVGDGTTLDGTAVDLAQEVLAEQADDTSLEEAIDGALRSPEPSAPPPESLLRPVSSGKAPPLSPYVPRGAVTREQVRAACRRYAEAAAAIQGYDLGLPSNDSPVVRQCREGAPDVPPPALDSQRWFLGIAPDAATYSIVYFLGHYAHNRFDMQNAQGPMKLDMGNVLYAPLAFYDQKEGRHIIWGYLKELWSIPPPPSMCNKYAHSGCVSLPRALYFQSGRLYQVPLPELARLRKGDPWLVEGKALAPGTPLVLPSSLDAIHLDVEITVRRGDSKRVVIWLPSWRVHSAGAAALVFDWETLRLEVRYHVVEEGLVDEATVGAGGGEAKAADNGTDGASDENDDGAKTDDDKSRCSCAAVTGAEGAFPEHCLPPEEQGVLPRKGGLNRVQLNPSVPDDNADALDGDGGDEALAAGDDSSSYLIWHDAQIPPVKDMNPDVPDWMRMKKGEAGGRLWMEEGDALTLRAFIDASAVEVFTGTGQAISTRLYRGTPPADGSGPAGLIIASQGGTAQVDYLSVHTMDCAWLRREDMPLPPPVTPEDAKQWSRVDAKGRMPPGTPAASKPSTPEH